MEKWSTSKRRVDAEKERVPDRCLGLMVYNILLRINQQRLPLDKQCLLSRVQAKTGIIGFK